MPSLVIVDGTPKNEVQFLCRVQAVNEIEEHYLKKLNKSVLTKNHNNIITLDGKRAIVNDTHINELNKKPALLSNLLQYTPAHLALSFMQGENIRRRDILYGELISKN